MNNLPILSVPSISGRALLPVAAGAGFLLLAAVAGSTTATYQYVPVGIAAILLGIYLFSRSVALVFLAAILLTAATYRGIFLHVRVNLLGTPFSVYDGLWLVVLSKVLISTATARNIRLPLPIILFGISTISTVFLGIAFQQPTYSIVRLFRAEAFLVAGFLGGFLLPPRHRFRALQVIAAAGTLMGLQQLATSGFALLGIRIWSRLGIEAFGDRSDSFDVAYAMSMGASPFRDLGVTIPFVVIGALVLISAFFTGQRLFAPHTMQVCLTICLLGIAMSLTRSSWLGLGVGVSAIVWAFRGRSLGRLVASVAPLILAALLAITTLQVIGEVGERFLSLFETRVFSTIGEGTGDSALQDRVAETQAALDMLGNYWWLGVGAADIVYEGTSSAIDETVRSQLHNGYLQYLLANGLLGLGSILALLLLGIVKAWKSARRASSPQVKFLGLASFSCLVYFSVGSITGGNVNDAFLTPVVGLLLSLNLHNEIDQPEITDTYTKGNEDKCSTLEPISHLTRHKVTSVSR